jgi:hypothetical protein
MLCWVVYDVLDCWYGVVEAGSFSKISGLSMHVALVGILRGNDSRFWVSASALLLWLAVLLW